MFIDMSSTFQKTFVQIAQFDWLPGRQKGLIFHKKTFVQIAQFDWLPGRQKTLIFEKIFAETVRWMKLILCIHVYGIK